MEAPGRGARSRRQPRERARRVPRLCRPGHGRAHRELVGHHALKIAIWGGEKPEAIASRDSLPASSAAEGRRGSIGEADHVLSRTIVVDGLIAGFWEVDPKRSGAVWHTFDPAPKTLAAQLDELTAAAAKFLLDDIGHAKVFTLDTMEEVQARADRVAKLRAGTKTKKK